MLSVGRLLKHYSSPIDSLAPNLRTLRASSMSLGLGRFNSPPGTLIGRWMLGVETLLTWLGRAGLQPARESFRSRADKPKRARDFTAPQSVALPGKSGRADVKAERNSSEAYVLSLRIGAALRHRDSQNLPHADRWWTKANV